MPLISGKSASVVQENIRALKALGLSERDATARASQHAAGVRKSTDNSKDRQFVVVTRDFSGLGWAKKLQEEGERVTVATCCPEEKAADRKLYEAVGSDWFTCLPLDAAVKKLQTPTTYWIFAENDSAAVADRLRRAGQKVFGTSALTEALEHDRQKAVDIAEKAGLKSPETHEFSSVPEGLSFLDAHKDKAYVLKPDDASANHLTFVPVREDDKDANRETYTYLQHAKPGTYILQERIKGTELNVECWMYEGEPFFAFVTLESKRKDTGDLGEMSGCAGDLLWTVDVDGSLMKQTLGKMLPYYKSQKYTGFADVNVILTDKGPRFLEVCDRFGYNSHPNLFITLAKDSFGDIMADFMDGDVWDMPDRFKKGFGASLTVFLDHPVEGLPIHVKDEERFFPFDGMMEDGQMLLCGYSNEVGIYTGYGSSPESAMSDVLDALRVDEAVSYPGIYYRTDLTEHKPNLPLKRYYELVKKGLA